MRPSRWILSAVLMLTAWGAAPPGPVAARADEAAAPWRTDLHAARAEAEAGRKPLLVVFRCER
jgi:hypothetical protein